MANIFDYLEWREFPVEGKHAVVIGRSPIVGKPVAQMLTDKNMTVTVCHSKTPRIMLNKLVRQADLIISAVGIEHFLDCTDLTAQIVDVGINFNAEGKINDYSLLSHAETPGLGSKAADWFKKGQKGDITGMNPGENALVVSKDGGSVDAITASTITSRAFLSAVNAAYAAYAGQNTTETDGTTGATVQANVEQPTEETVTTDSSSVK